MYVAEIAFLMTTFRSAWFSSPSSMKCSQTFQTQRDCRLLKKKIMKIQLLNSLLHDVLNYQTLCPRYLLPQSWTSANNSDLNFDN